MAIKTTTNIDIDFCNKKYVLVNAKQLDKNSRFLSVTCYNHGELFSLNSGEHAAYIRYKKADDYGVFNNCDIDRFGKIIVELTEQMLAVDGICYADLIIVNKGDAVVDPNTGEINEKIDNASILSTMTFCIDVSEIPVMNSEIESTYEFILLNDNLEKYWADFEDVMKTSKSWAVGGTGIRNGENTDNSKYWAEQSKKGADAASDSADNAATSESNANEYMNNALAYSQDSESYMNSAEGYKNEAFDSATASANSAAAALDSEGKSKASEEAAKSSEDKAMASENAAAQSETNAQTYMNEASVSKTNAKISEDNALNSANRAQSYAVGGTGTRDGEDSDNAQWYYNEIKDILNGLNIVFVPKGTIYFSELATVKETAVAGYIYNIKDDFVTDETFREGNGVTYTAGTNVYYVIDENGEYKWDCFGGAASPTATVSEVKDYLGINEEIDIV